MSGRSGRLASAYRALPIAVAALASSGAAGAFAQSSAAYAAVVHEYRRGEFEAALRAGARLPVDELLDHADDWSEAVGPASAAADLDLLAAALLHIDLAGLAGIAPEVNERAARRLLERVSEPRREAWLRSAHLGLAGLYVMAPQVPAATQVMRFLISRYGDDPVVRFTRARMAELVGWFFHDDRFLEQARMDYRRLLGDSRAAEVGLDLEEIRIRFAHTLLRSAEPADAIAELDRAPLESLPAPARFAALLIRGEALLWLQRNEEAGEAFAAARDLDPGSGSAVAALIVAGHLLRDPEGGAATAAGFVEEPVGPDLWHEFLHRGLWEESARLIQFRRLVASGR